MFRYNVPGRKCKKQDGDAIIAELAVPLKKDTTTTETDALETCINDMFGDSNELENTELEIHDDYTGIPDTQVDGPAVVHSDTNDNDNDNDNDTVMKIALGNIFEKGREKMVKANMADVRLRKKNRMIRSRQFLLDINTNVIDMEVTLEVELNKITNTQLFDPWYRTAVRLICK